MRTSASHASAGVRTHGCAHAHAYAYAYGPAGLRVYVRELQGF